MANKNDLINNPGHYSLEQIVGAINAGDISLYELIPHHPQACLR